MPQSPPRLCPRCHQVTAAHQPCPNCPTGWAANTHPGRPTNTRRRRRQRALMLSTNPVCNIQGCNEPATQDDHIVPWSQRGTMTDAEWDAPANHQGLCLDHHNAKTATEAQAGRHLNRP